MHSLPNKDFRLKFSLFVVGTITGFASYLPQGTSRDLVSSWSKGVFNFSMFSFSSNSNSRTKQFLSSLLGYLILIPKEVFEMESENLRNRIIVRLAIGSGFVNSIYSDSMENLENCLEILKSDWDNFLFDLEDGDFSDWHKLPRELRQKIKPLTRPKPEWAEVLRLRRADLLAQGADIRLIDVFPNLKTVWGKKAWESLPGPAPCQRKRQVDFS